MLTQAEFTELFAGALRHMDSSVTVLGIELLRVDFVRANGGTHRFLLQNAYEAYSRNPQELVQLLTRYVASAQELDAVPNGMSTIVPVVKNTAWLQITRQQLVEASPQLRPGASPPAADFDFVLEPLTGELVVVYAEDTPLNIKFMSAERMKDLGVDRGEVRRLALSNLEATLPKIERHEDAGVYRFTTDGAYTASLLLLDTFWAGVMSLIHGTVAVGVPSRDQLFVAPASDAQAVSRMRELVRREHEASSYRLSPGLFLYEEGRLSTWSERRGESSQ